MSETFVTSSPVFKDLDLLREAFKQLNWELKEQQKARTWPSNPEREKVYPYVAINPYADGYDVGVVPDAKAGRIDLEADLFSPGKVVKELGKEFCKLTQRYNIAHHQRAALQQGWRTRVVKELDGDIYMEVTS